MNTQDFSQLRHRAGKTQAATAEALGVTTRTIAGWEAAYPPREFSRLEARAISGLFQPEILDAQLCELADQAAREVPSEVVAIWLVRQQECILLPAGVRYQFLKVPSPECVASLAIVSLTTYPLRTGERLNLAGDAIANHMAKKYKGTRGGSHFKDGVCESLLHVPAFIPSARGPQPVLLLSLENRLDGQGRVIRAEPGPARIYSSADVEAAERLARAFKDRLLPDMRLLDMLDWDEL